jgi:hypothetical protein
MFTPEHILDRMRQRPFLPVRITTSSGNTYDVTHPDLALVGRRDLIIGAANARNPATYDAVSRIAIGHITATDDVPAAADASGNGQNGAT